MPYRPKKPCAYPGCPNLTDKRYCPTHKKKLDGVAYNSITHFGGHIVFDEGCEIVGLPKAASLSSDSSAADIIAALKASGYMSTEPNWTLVLENSKWDKGSGRFLDENANFVFSDSTDIEVQASGNDCWTVTVNREESESVQRDDR